MSPSSLVTSRRFRCAAIAAAAALALVIPQASSAAALRPPAVAATGIPSFVHLPADQAAHPNSADEWWYTVGHQGKPVTGLAYVEQFGIWK